MTTSPPPDPHAAETNDPEPIDAVLHAAYTDLVDDLGDRLDLTGGLEKATAPGAYQALAHDLARTLDLERGFAAIVDGPTGNGPGPDAEHTGRGPQDVRRTREGRDFAITGQQVQTNMIVRAFAAMGGDPANAVAAARGYSSTTSWTASQAAQAAAAGAGALAVPGVHVAAMVADLPFLLHKLAYCCWGIGALRGAVVEGKEDFALILRYWSGDLAENELPAAILTGTTAGAAALLVAQKGAAEATGQVAGEAVGKGVDADAAALAKKLGVKVGAKAVGKLTSNVTGRLTEKAATKIALTVSVRLAGKSLAGFLPFVGPAVGGAVNAYFVKDIADAAAIYYRVKADLLD